MKFRAAIAILLAIAACEGGQSPGEDSRQTVAEIPATPNRDLDLLFMIDNSGTMLDKQANLVANFPTFINKLASAPEGLPNLHLGVISSDMGTLGTAVATPGMQVGQIGNGGCAGSGDNGVMTNHGAPVVGNFLIDTKLESGARETNYTGDLATVFGQMASLGGTGCGFEQQLHAVKAALDNNPANAGFLRPDALLAVVLVTDEDDCSVKDPQLMSAPDTDVTLGKQQSFRCTRFGVTCGQGGATPDAMNVVGTKGDCAASTTSDLVDDVDSYHDFLVGLKGDPKRVVATAIMGVTEPFAVEMRTINGISQTALAHSCTFAGPTGPQLADPGVRIQNFLDLFPNRSTSSSICQADLSGGLDLIGDLVGGAVGSACIDATLADIDVTTPGLQVDCLVDDIVGTDGRVIVPCDATETPTCWKLETDAASCPGGQNVKLVVLRAEPPNPATITRASCIVAE